MPLYKAECDRCGFIKLYSCALKDRDALILCAIPACGGLFRRFLSAPVKATILEVGSKYHGFKKRKGIETVLKKRSKQDLLNNVGELVEKHGLKTMAQSPLLKDGRKRKALDDK